MALIESVFRRPAGDRIIPFSTIAHETGLPIHEVEHLVMKALSLNLIKGSIDQVAATAKITWVQPRVLDRDQIDGLRQRLAEWCGKVAKVGDSTITNAPELFVQ
jgi:26S proteasome regulatory subunit N9